MNETHLTRVCVSVQVFGTNVMVTVAKSFEAPIKCESLTSPSQTHAHVCVKPQFSIKQ